MAVTQPTLTFYIGSTILSYVGSSLWYMMKPKEPEDKSVEISRRTIYTIKTYDEPADQTPKAVFL